MQTQFAFFASIAFSLIAWGMVAARYIWPELRLRQRAEALRPLLILHSFRFIGLAFLVPGVVSLDLPSAFAHSAAYGDMIAAILALLALILLPSTSGIVISLDLQCLGYRRSLQCFLPSQPLRTHSGTIGCQLFHSDFHGAPTADHAWTRFPDSIAT